MASMAHAAHMDETDFYTWTIRKFILRKEAIDRAYRYLICAVSEAAGGKFKNGNPAPSWCFERDKNASPLTPLSTFMEQGPGNIAKPKT